MMQSLLKSSFILVNFVQILESFGFKECGQYGTFLFWDKGCYFVLPHFYFANTNCTDFDFKPYNTSHIGQGTVVRVKNNTGLYFWVKEQRDEVVYYERAEKAGSSMTKRRFPFNTSHTEYVRMFITPSERFLSSTESRKFYINGTEFQPMEGKEWSDLLSVTDSPLILFLIREDDKFQFIYIDSGRVV